MSEGEKRLTASTVTEKILRHPGAGAAAAVVGSGAGLLLGDASPTALAVGAAQLLPWLTGVLPALHAQRQCEFLEDLQQQLHGRCDPREVNEDQYTVICEAVAASFSTISSEKLSVLKAAAIGAAVAPETVKAHATPLGRLLRDLSVVEVEFIVAKVGAPGVTIIGSNEPESADGRLYVRPDSPDEYVVSGLISLGLLYSKESTWDTPMYAWSPMARKLVDLLKAGA
ncbi:hypothetical protein [Ramlibacter sp.]|uniref:hypothetical protein n=1 Tax=Ramlibacter sp. TaxID=1917967 RepID=UPI003D0A81C8